MKSILASLIMASLALADPPCNPVPLYRKRAINPTNGLVDRFDTTDINEAHQTHVVDRQIATICSNEAPGTVPLYRGINHGNGLHMSSINLNEEEFAGYTRERVSGFVYTQPQQGQTGFFNVSRIEIKGNVFLSSNINIEGGIGAVKEVLFLSLPMNAGRPFSEYPKSCNPVALYRKRAPKLTYEPYVYPSSEFYKPRDPADGFLDRYDTTDINEDSSTHTVERQIATVCSNQAPGTVPLYRGYNSNLVLHISTINATEPAFKGFTKDRLTGYVYTEIPNNRADFFQIYRIHIKKSEYMTTEQSNEAIGAEIPLFYSMPLEEAKPLSDYPIKFQS